MRFVAIGVVACVCNAAAMPADDCDASGHPDITELDPVSDCDANGVLDFCETIPWSDTRLLIGSAPANLWTIATDTVGGVVRIYSSVQRTPNLIRQDYDLAGHALGAPITIPVSAKSSTEWARNLELADLDHDGHNDLVALIDGQVFAIRLRDGVPQSTQVLDVPCTNPSQVTAQDLDGDGWTDVIVGGCTDQLVAFRNSNGSLVVPVTLPHPYLGNAHFLGRRGHGRRRARRRRVLHEGRCCHLAWAALERRHVAAELHAASRALAQSRPDPR